MVERLRFRRAETADALLLTEIAYAGKQFWGYPAEWMELWRHDLLITAHYLKSEPVQIAEYGDDVVGFVGLSSGEEGRHLEHLWLKPPYIGRGFGRALFQEAVRLAGEEGLSELWINSDPNAEPFYLKMGAIRIGQEIYSLPGAVRREVPLLIYRLSD